MKSMRDLLIYSLDNELSASEKASLDKALANDVELQKDRDSLLKMRDLLSGFEISENADFSNKVIESIENQELKIENPFGAKVFSLFPKVAAASVAILVIAMSALYFSEMNFVSDSLVGIEDLTLDEAYTYLEF